MKFNWFKYQMDLIMQLDNNLFPFIYEQKTNKSQYKKSNMVAKIIFAVLFLYLIAVIQKLFY